jgi:hypothetical protein
MYDAETNANGFSVDGILPSAFSTKLYWCDTALNITTNNTCPATPTAAENADNNNTGIGVDNSIAGTTGITHAWNGAGANFNTPAATGTDGSASTNLCDDFGNARTINTWFWPTVSTAANFTVTVPTGCITLASDKLNLTAAIQQNDVAVQWVTVNETNYKQFEIQRSSDGINFTTIATQNATISGSDKNYYNYIDKNVSNKVFYRIKVITITDAVSYSKVICVQTLATNNLSTMVYPNPVDPTSALSFRLTKKENLKLSINNTAGAVLVIFTINGAAGANQLALSDYTAKLLPGIYYITLQGQSGKAIQKIIKL